MAQLLQSNRRAFRVRGQRKDGSWKFKDVLQEARAESIASRWLKNHPVTRDGREVWEEPLTNVTIIRSEPLVWILDEEPR